MMEAYVPKFNQTIFKSFCFKALYQKVIIDLFFKKMRKDSNKKCIYN